MQDKVLTRILLIHLGAMGAVVRSTALIKAIRKQYPSCHITWLTTSPVNQLIDLARVDRVMVTSHEDLLVLESLEFDFAFCIDKSPMAGSIVNRIRADIKLGFAMDSRSGAIVPLNPEAHELFELGLSNFKKFFVNSKPENQLVAEALKLKDYNRDDYDLPLEAADLQLVKNDRSQFSKNDPKQPVIGINTGCGPLMPAKKLSIDGHQRLLSTFLDKGYVNLVLLGGKDDLERAQEISEPFGGRVQISNHTGGLRAGYRSISACDIVVTGDSLGMHLAIAARKWVVAWFGPSCAHEIDLFDRGVKVLTKANCSPCWKRVCHKDVMCYDQVNLEEIVNGVDRGFQQWEPALNQVIEF